MKPKPLDPQAKPADSVAGNPFSRFAPEFSRPFVELARLDRPAGWWLLLLPCWWSAALAGIAAGKPPNPWHLMLFLIGAIAMRGAGSTWNDIVDRKLDAGVARTKGRPLPSGRVTAKAAAVFAALLSLIGLAVLLQLNWFSVALGFCSLIPVAIYPFMKRVTTYPQFVLGLAFSWGGLMGWAAVFGALSRVPALIYAAAIAWTIGYDTIYAMQDLEDDAIVGIRSTARHFGDSSVTFIRICYLTSVVLLAFAAMRAGAGPFAALGLTGFAFHLRWQIRCIDVSNPDVALKLFKSNRDAGLILFAGLVLDALLMPVIGSRLFGG